MDNGFDWDAGELWCWDKGLCSVAFPPSLPHSSPLSPPPPRLPIHLSCSNHLGSCHLIQLITAWDGLWETRQVRGFTEPKHALTHGTTYSTIYNVEACEQAWLLDKLKVEIPKWSHVPALIF